MHKNAPASPKEDKSAFEQIYSDVRKAKQVAERQVERFRLAPFPSESGKVSHPLVPPLPDRMSKASSAASPLQTR